MRSYELVLIIDPELTSEKQKKLFEKIQSWIGNLKGSVEKTREWGRKIFAYPLRKKTQGDYFLWEINLPEDKVGEFNQNLKIEEEILRYLLVRKEVPKQKGEGGKRGAKVAK